MNNADKGCRDHPKTSYVNYCKFTVVVSLNDNSAMEGIVVPEDLSKIVTVCLFLIRKRKSGDIPRTLIYWGLCVLYWNIYRQKRVFNINVDTFNLNKCPLIMINKCVLFSFDM